MRSLFPCLHFKPIVCVRVATPKHLPKTSCGICQQEKHSPQFVLTDVRSLMRPQAAEFCLSGCDHDMAERDCVEGKRFKKSIGPFEPGERDFDDTIDRMCGSPEGDCWGNKAKTHGSARCDPEVSRETNLKGHSRGRCHPGKGMNVSRWAAKGYSTSSSVYQFHPPCRWCKLIPRNSCLRKCRA